MFFLCIITKILYLLRFSLYFFFRKFFQVIANSCKKRRQRFNNQQLEEMKSVLTSSSFLDSLLASSASNVAKYYYIKNNYELINNNAVAKKRGGGKVVISENEIYSTINDSHVASGHGGEKRTYHELRKHRKIANVTLEQIKVFISLCEVCQRKKQKRNNNKKSVISIVSSKFGERGQIDLIDLSMNPTPDGYKYILNYQDHLTKFVILKPLKSKKSSDVNDSLLDIFTTIGVPQILQCDNGNEFSEIKPKLLDMHWPQCKMVRSRPRHPQSQGSVERANGDVMNMLRCWMADQSSSDWVKGLKFVQLQKNNAFNRTINCSPFYATFGRELPVDFIGSSNANEEEEMIISGESNEEEEIMLSLENNNDNITNAEEEEEMMESNLNDDDDDVNSSSKQILNNIESINSIRNVIAQDLSSSSSSSSSNNSTEIAIGTPIVIKTPKIDCPKLAFPNIIGVIHKYIRDIDKYEIKTKYGIIDRKFSSTDFQLSPNLNVYINNDDETFISLRQVARLDCIQFVGCKCYGKCQNRVCFCFKNNKLCGSFCKHKGSDTVCINTRFKKTVQIRKCHY